MKRKKSVERRDEDNDNEKDGRNQGRTNPESDYQEKDAQQLIKVSLRPKSSLSVAKYSQKNAEKMNLTTLDCEANSSKFGAFTCSRPSR